MKLNEGKLTAMVEAVMKIKYPNGRPSFTYWDGRIYDEYKESVRNALTPFCMEMTDEEIVLKSSYSDPPLHYRFGFIDGAKFIRDKK